MRLYPAIDIKDGKCVRLKQGKFDDVKVYFEEPYKAAEYFASEGASFLHLVDLDGARIGAGTNDVAVKSIISAANIPVEIGGGIRTLNDIEYKLGLGVTRVIIGTKAVENPSFIEEAVKNFGSDKIVVGIDAVNGNVAVEAWEKVSKTEACELALLMKQMGVTTIIYTDISKDGMLCGPNIEQTKKMVDTTGMDIIASGGVSSIADLKRVAEINAEGAIIGKALYEGKIQLKDAVNKFRM